MDCSLSGSSVHGIFQARVLEWGATAFCYTSLLLVPWFSHVLYFKYLLPKSANDFVRREKRLSFMIYWNYPQLVESTTLAPFLTSFSQISQENMPFILYEAAVCVMNQVPPNHCRTMTHGLSLSCYFSIFFSFLTSTFININIFLIFHPGHLFFNYPPSHSRHCYLVSLATTFLKLPMFSNKLTEKSITYSVHILPEGRRSLLLVFLGFSFLYEWSYSLLGLQPISMWMEFSNLSYSLFSNCLLIYFPWELQRWCL